MSSKAQKKIKVKSTPRIFVDYYHKNKVVQIDGKKYLRKRLNNYSILKKEYQVIKFLEKYNVVPKVCQFKKNSFAEEYIEGTRLDNRDLTKENIIKLAKTVRLFHSLGLPGRIKRLIKDELVVDKYKPSLIFETIIKEAPSEILGSHCGKLRKTMRKMDLYFNKKPYRIGLVHGDLSCDNIIIKNKEIFIIDWSDCRLDILSCDISQLFYLCDFTKEQEKIFLENYDIGYIDDKVLTTHKILLLLFDIADCFIKGREVDNKKLNQLNQLVN